MNAKILIADDESDIVSMLGSFFESKGFRALPASNGAEALKQLRSTMNRCRSHAFISCGLLRKNRVHP